MGWLKDVFTAGTVAFSLGYTPPADAGENIFADKRAPKFGQFLIFGAETTTPKGYMKYCEEKPEECRFRFAAATRVSMDLVPVIDNINREGNALIAPQTDQDQYGREEVWTVPERRGGGLSGDCEDYVLWKLEKLAEAGIPRSAMAILVVQQKNGTNHAVLAVRMERSDAILDNLDDSLKTPEEIPYSLIKATTMTDWSRWNKIEAGFVPATADAIAAISP